MSFQIPGLVIVPLVFAFVATSSLTWLYPALFLAESVHRRRSSASGATICRGCIRPICAPPARALRPTSAAVSSARRSRWVTATLAVTSDRAYAPRKVALVAAGVAFAVYLVGFIASFWLPEPNEELPD